MKELIEPSWREVLSDEFEKTYFKMLTNTVDSLYRDNESIFPPQQFLFNAFALCPFDSVKVVILGQDPYHGAGQAHGLCFSVHDDIPIPPSLKNIFKELQDDLGISPHSSGDLTHWAKQGVLLLNTTLTVNEGLPNSHKGLGWETFTDAVIQKISDEKEHLVFLLWGAHAQKKGALIDREKHLVLEAPHPSPLSAYGGFFGCRHFSKANEYLIAHKESTIVW